MHPEMSSALDQLIGAPLVEPPFDIMRAAYVELMVKDIAVSERFYVDLLGLVVSHRTDDALYLRGWEERLHHSLVLRRAAAPACGRLAFRVRGERDLDLLATEFERRGCVVRHVE